MESKPTFARAHTDRGICTRQHSFHWRERSCRLLLDQNPPVDSKPHYSNSFKITTEKTKKDAIKKATRVSDLLVDKVNSGVQECFINQKRIELEIRALASIINRFMKQSDEWLAATHALNTAVKEIGDFENWMKTMEFDCRSINVVIHNIYQE